MMNVIQNASTLLLELKDSLFHQHCRINFITVSGRVALESLVVLYPVPRLLFLSQLRAAYFLDATLLPTNIQMQLKIIMVEHYALMELKD